MSLSCIEFCGQLLGRPPTGTIRCSLTPWRHSIFVPLSDSDFPVNRSRVPPAFRHECYRDCSDQRLVDDGRRLGKLAATLRPQGLWRHCCELARHGRRYRTTSARPEKLLIAWTDRCC